MQHSTPSLENRAVRAMLAAEEDLELAHAAYRRVRDVISREATPPPSAASARTPHSHGPSPLSRELGSDLRALRAMQAAEEAGPSRRRSGVSPARFSLPHTPGSEQRRSARSLLEGQLLDALDTVEGIEHERDELLRELAQARAHSSTDEVERLRDENLELRDELAALRDDEAERGRLSFGSVGSPSMAPSPSRAPSASQGTPEALTAELVAVKASLAGRMCARAPDRTHSSRPRLPAVG